MQSADGVEIPEQLGDFRIQSVLGDGGSGVVYAARWGHREVALKVLRADLVPTESAHKKFLSEAKILAGIEHASVVKVLGYGELPDGRPYLAMEKLEGETLAERLLRGRLTVEHALDVFEQIASAVAALHDKGLIHRDLKPENVFLVAGGDYAVLLDMGIAKDLDAAATVTQEGLVKGTPAYMAPERFFGAPATASSDIYELAVALFAMLTGRLPWDVAEDPEARLNPLRPSDCGVALPGALEPELMRALSTRPESRPASAAEFLRGVQESQADAATIAARATVDIRAKAPPASTETLERQARRRSLFIAVVGIAVGVAGLATAALVGMSGGDDDKTPIVTEEDKLPPPPEPEPEPKPTPRPTPGPRPEQRTPPVPERAWRYHSRDTNVLAGVAWGRLTNSALWRAMSRELDIKELAAFDAIVQDQCGFDPLESLNWFTVGVPNGKLDQFEMAAGGEFERDKLEDCLRHLLAFSGENAKLVRADKHTRFEFRDETALLGWPDNSEVIFTNRPRADGNWMSKRIVGFDSTRKNKALMSLKQRIDPEATIWIVTADASWMDLGTVQGAPQPDAMYTSITLTDGATMEVGWRYDSAVQATAATKALQKSLDDLTKDAFVSYVIGEAKVEQDGVDAVITIKTDPGTTALIGKALGTTLTDSFKSFPY